MGIDYYISVLFSFEGRKNTIGEQFTDYTGCIVDSLYHDD